MTYKSGAVTLAHGEIVMGDEDQWYWNDWKEYQIEVKQDLGIEYEFWDEQPKNNTITFEAGEGNEMIKITPEGFYVRGVRVEADAKEAENVYKAFKQWLTWNTLSNQNN
jgi:hypothetical protein